MSRARFIGDPRHGGEGPGVMTTLGLSFVKDEWRDIPASAVAKLQANNHFDVDTDGDGEPGPTLESLRVQLDALGIRYHHKAGVAKLQALMPAE